MGKQSKATTSSEPSAWAKSYLTPAASAVGSAYAAAQPGVAAAQQAIGAAIPAVAARATGDDPVLTAASGYDAGVLGGRYLGQGNPYLAQMIGQTDASVADRVNAQFGAAGRTGSGANAYELARALGQNEDTLRYGDYSQERGAMAQAAGQAPGLVSAQYAGIAPLLGLAGATTLGQDSSSRYAGGVAGLVGNSVGQTQTTAPSTASSVAQGVGTALQIASLFSDRRLKRGIRRIGSWADGLGLYVWRYVWGGPPAIGVMADEVARLRPWALGPVIGGYATVDYPALAQGAGR